MVIQFQSHKYVYVNVCGGSVVCQHLRLSELEQNYSVKLNHIYRIFSNLIRTRFKVSEG
jgi:hypothetical protein